MLMFNRTFPEWNFNEVQDDRIQNGLLVVKLRSVLESEKIFMNALKNSKIKVYPLESPSSAEELKDDLEKIALLLSLKSSF